MRLIIINLILALVLSCSAYGQHAAPDSSKKNSFVGLPVVFYLPETNFGFGAAGLYFFRMKNVSEKTRLSSVQMLATYTLNKQLLFKMPYEFHFDDNQHIVKGEMTWFKYPLKFFGIGPNASFENEEDYSSRTLWIRADYLYQVWDNLFIGTHYRLDVIRDVQLESETGELSTGNVLGSNGGNASGLGLMISYDKRDNIYVPSRGPFIEISTTLNRSWLGSDFRFSRIEMDGRHYVNVAENHQLCVHGVADITWGDVPFESLGLLGYRTINRGYYEGRYRDNVMAAAQVEYRVNLFRGGFEREELPFFRRFSLAVFACAGNVAPSVRDFRLGFIKYSYGAGVRFLVSRRENVTARFDYGFGRPGNSGAYFTIGEAF